MAANLVMRTFTCITYDVVQTPRLQLRVERLEQPAAQPRVLSDERDELGRGAALRLAVDVEAAPFVTLLDVAAGQVDAEHALLALGGDRVRRDLW